MQRPTFAFLQEHEALALLKRRLEDLSTEAPKHAPIHPAVLAKYSLYTQELRELVLFELFDKLIYDQNPGLEYPLSVVRSDGTELKPWRDLRITKRAINMYTFTRTDGRVSYLTVEEATMNPALIESYTLADKLAILDK